SPAVALTAMLCAVLIDAAKVRVAETKRTQGNLPVPEVSEDCECPSHALVLHACMNNDGDTFLMMCTVTKQVLE
ncbi:MAG: hypothetical protein KDI71_21020, partial [Xanthomonadales bacterium]|nr:hypothetical protein [Xanthomonadales bacterium]